MISFLRKRGQASAPVVRLALALFLLVPITAVSLTFTGCGRALDKVNDDIDPRYDTLGFDPSSPSSNDATPRSGRAVNVSDDLGSGRRRFRTGPIGGIARAVTTTRAAELTENYQIFDDENPVDHADKIVSLRISQNIFPEIRVTFPVGTTAPETFVVADLRMSPQLGEKNVTFPTETLPQPVSYPTLYGPERITFTRKGPAIDETGTVRPNVFVYIAEHGTYDNIGPVEQQSGPMALDAAEYAEWRTEGTAHEFPLTCDGRHGTTLGPRQLSGDTVDAIRGVVFGSQSQANVFLLNLEFVTEGLPAGTGFELNLMKSKVEARGLLF